MTSSLIFSSSHKPLGFLISIILWRLRAGQFLVSHVDVFVHPFRKFAVVKVSILKIPFTQQRMRQGLSNTERYRQAFKGWVADSVGEYRRHASRGMIEDFKQVTRHGRSIPVADGRQGSRRTAVGYRLQAR